MSVPGTTLRRTQARLTETGRRREHIPLERRPDGHQSWICVLWWLLQGTDDLSQGLPIQAPG